MKTRIVLMLSLAMVLATAAPAMAKDKDVNIDLRSSKTATVTAGDTVWVAIDWLAKGGDATDFRVLAEASNGVTVAYPYKSLELLEGDNTFTSLYGDSTLSESEIDFTAIRLEVPLDVPKNIDLVLSVSYTTNDKPKTETFKAKVPTVQYDGQDLEQVTTTFGPIDAGAETWVEVDYKGFAPGLEDFDVVVTDDAGFGVYYPSGTTTSLNHDSTLERNETDFVAFRLAASDPGIYDIQVSATYTKGGKKASLDGTITITVSSPTG